MGARSYIIALAACTALLAVLVSTFNYLVDPYGITGTQRIPGFNQYKVDINDRVRLAKKYQPLHGEFNAVIVGNSRVEMGLDPGHRCFRETGLAPYNAGVPGAGVRRQLQYALNVIHAQPVRRAFVGVDFFDFVSSTPVSVRSRESLFSATNGDFRFLPSGRENPGFRKKFTMDLYQSVFSLDATVSSARTVILQGSSTADRDPAGFNPARDMAHAVAVEGPRALFDQKMSSLEAGYASERFLYYPGESANAYLSDLAELLDRAAEMEMEIDLFIGPFHRLYWDLLDNRNMLPLYDRWRDAVVELASARADTQELALWDFARIAPYTEETVPAAGTRPGPLRWFWEPSHYRSELGDLMLDTMLSETCEADALIGRNLLAPR